jgi:NAD(P)-dependent dehydrogenase (short-subunit alcohol dehydrogenase family)
VFTFGDDARSSYERMIAIVSEAERYLEEHADVELARAQATALEPLRLAELRRAVSDHAGSPMVAHLDADELSVGFSEIDDVAALAARGPLTPDHVIRTKRTAVVVEDNFALEVERYAEAYRAYFDRNTDGSLTCLDSAPRWAVWPGHGTVAFGRTEEEAGIVADIKDHTIAAIQKAEAMGGWRPLEEDDIFAVEYWELEQAKLSRAGSAPEFAGKVVLITGAASGIGLACVRAFRERGACVAALDIDPGVRTAFGEGHDTVLAIECDVTDPDAVAAAVDDAVCRFGGLDVVVSNAGVFPPSAEVADISSELWDRSLAVNLTAHQTLVQKTVPYLALGIDPAIVIVGSKNVAAPGPGAAAYSVAKAGLTQLARVAALELAPRGVRVNVLHPNDVFDTALWTDDVLESRAAHYGLTVPEYKRKNLLGVEVRSSHVAAMACAMAGALFSRTTGAQVAIDGGNDRVI